MSIETLTPGEIYGIVDYYGMMAMEGTYIGIGRDQANYTPKILIFSYAPKWEDAPPIGYAGCLPEAYIMRGYDGKPDSIGVNLRVFYYGNSIDTLKHVTEGRKPRWEVEK